MQSQKQVYGAAARKVEVARDWMEQARLHEDRGERNMASNCRKLAIGVIGDAFRLCRDGDGSLSMADIGLLGAAKTLIDRAERGVAEQVLEVIVKGAAK